MTKHCHLIVKLTPAGSKCWCHSVQYLVRPIYMRLAESHIMEDVINRDVPTKTVVLPLVGSVSRGAIGSVSRGAPATGGESSDKTASKGLAHFSFLFSLFKMDRRHIHQSPN